jgi:hypothetical protein
VASSSASASSLVLTFLAGLATGVAFAVVAYVIDAPTSSSPC